MTRKILLIAAAVGFHFGIIHADIFFSGTDKQVISEVPEKNTGLNTIYVVNSTDGVRLHYTSSSSSVGFSHFRNLGAGYAEEIKDVIKDGNDWSVSLSGDTGYLINDGGKQIAIWVVDYSLHRMQLEGIHIPAEQECESTTIELSGKGDAIHYYTLNGQQKTLSRDIQISYTTQISSEDNLMFDAIETYKSIEYLEPIVYITPAVYCDTYFQVSGDRFLKAWGEMQQAESSHFTAVAVDVNTTAEQKVASTDEEYKSNQINSGNSGLGGSAPAEISFNAYCTDAVIHYEWQMAEDADFENITYRFNEQDLDYTFLTEGTVYVRFVGSNATGSCEQYGDVYTVSIGASELKCPNAFSPGSTEGVNDEWKVSYRSLIEFECWIFDRYGNELCHFTDPEQGWDGKKGGKLVKPGVYFYVIQAKGADGKNYKRSGDINILRYSTYGGSNSIIE